MSAHFIHATVEVSDIWDRCRHFSSWRTESSKGEKEAVDFVDTGAGGAREAISVPFMLFLTGSEGRSKAY